MGKSKFLLIPMYPFLMNKWMMNDHRNSAKSKLANGEENARILLWIKFTINTVAFSFVILWCSGNPHKLLDMERLKWKVSALAKWLS